MGMNVQVFRWNLGDCTNNGESSNHNGFCVLNVEGPFEPSDDYPAARLLRHPTVKDHCFIVPDEKLKGGKPYMFGGNFAYTSDGRFHETVKKLTGAGGSFAVQIHDRVE